MGTASDHSATVCPRFQSTVNLCFFDSIAKHCIRQKQFRNSSRILFSVVQLRNCGCVQKTKGSLTLAMGKCLWFSVKIKVCQSSLSSP